MNSLPSDGLKLILRAVVVVEKSWYRLAINDPVAKDACVVH
eukprot:CAMPEP_0175922496 /NCGR_PEP_ID=MMETSP0108-20121206/14078_1 /TAXON_ID=195067 ORGANISM="Goniomonas pacifica, Strain CCMP1869" /NCGR_SAMPLE_ID=MMETSP0108 /ASSEMBLY_ACC=CAM_ASM_000204 /LENGTH=40 /DNA_ID= /DNA_START= /DNA_END= /DNA_ORIENTATION=